MASLVLGPLLRWVGESQATVWVETDAACEVEVLGVREPTFHVEGHHYALVTVEGLEPGSTTPYEVCLDGERWQEPLIGGRWSFVRDFGRTRLVMIDTRGGRHFAGGRRSMVDDEEWDWIVDHARGGGGSPARGLLPAGLPAPGAAGPGSLERGRVRRRLDLCGGPARREDPAGGVTSRTCQAVCSPLRNPLNARERGIIRFSASPAARVIGRVLARLARVPRLPVRWRLVQAPEFGNLVAALEIDGPRSLVRIERVEDDAGEPRLRTCLTRRLA